MQIQTLIQDYWIYFLALILWSSFLKAIALYKSARNQDVAWFIAIFIINSVGLLEIFYLAVFSKQSKKSKKAETEEDED